jgi:hypothetical protein
MDLTSHPARGPRVVRCTIDSATAFVAEATLDGFDGVYATGC